MKARNFANSVRRCGDAGRVGALMPGNAVMDAEDAQTAFIDKIP